MSASSGSASPPAFSIFSASATRRSCRRATSATFAPSPASATAVASPIPEEAPVMTATLPSSAPIYLTLIGLVAVQGLQLLRGAVDHIDDSGSVVGESGNALLHALEIA